MSNTNRSSDVLIIGAGPAGASLALRLARAGFHVRIVEAHRFPRFKPCGEFVNPECVRILRELGVASELRTRGARPLTGFDLHGFGHRAAGDFVSVGRFAAPSAHGLALRRELLDEAVLRAAQRERGVEIHEGVRVTELLRGPRGEVRGARARDAAGEPLELEARLTVGADGLRSTVARSLGVHRPIGWLQRIALVTHYEDAAPMDRAEIHFVPGGYLVAHSVDQGLFSVNLVVDLAAVRASELTPAEFLEHFIETCPRLSARLASSRRAGPVRGVGPMASTTSRQIADGAALVGDAAGFVDPLTGEGVFAALKGAELLADCAGRALRNRRVDAQSLSEYALRRRRELAPRAAVARLLQLGLRREWIVAAVLSRLESRARLCDLLVSVAADYVPLREIARASVWRAALSRPVEPLAELAASVHRGDPV